jgi:hypothetical protein
MTETMIRGRAILAKDGSAYTGEIRVSGFPYLIRVTRHADGIEVVVRDTPPDPARDAASEVEFQAYLSRQTDLVAGG